MRPRHVGVPRGQQVKRAITANQASPSRSGRAFRLCRKNRHSRLCRIFRQDGRAGSAAAPGPANPANVTPLRCCHARSAGDRDDLRATSVPARGLSPPQRPREVGAGHERRPCRRSATPGTFATTSRYTFTTMPANISRLMVSTYGHVGYGYVSVFCGSPCPWQRRTFIHAHNRYECQARIP
jgi:hypothetical protein